MILSRSTRLLSACCAALALGTPTHRAAAEANPDVIGNYGPTGLELAYQSDLSLRVTSVQPGSPAEGQFSKGDVITAIAGSSAPADRWQRHAWLAAPITAAEASDGTIPFRVRKSGNGDAEDIQLTIPAIGTYKRENPAACIKTRTVIRAHAGFLHAKAATGDGLQSLAGHTMTNGTILLALLATGDNKDLDLVRRVYQLRMKNFTGTDTGAHTWHNGWQGIAVCEYFLRTGDATVMPLINAICESARKYQVNGGWTHWATGVNPHYVGGGLLNAAGTNMLTTLLLAKHCGATVDDETLHDALRYFFRFAGHGLNAYGDHRPENGYEGNNGKTEQLAIAMHTASLAENGGIYAMARDKSALSTLHAYPWMTSGHTGPIGLMYYGTAASYLADKKPELHAHWWNQTLWFRELSRRHDGAFSLAHAGRYRHLDYGSSLMLDFAAPLRTLQITGAPASPHAKPFRLPEHPWGRKRIRVDRRPPGSPRPMVPPHRLPRHQNIPPMENERQPSLDPHRSILAAHARATPRHRPR